MSWGGNSCARCDVYIIFSVALIDSFHCILSNTMGYIDVLCGCVWVGWGGWGIH